MGDQTETARSTAAARTPAAAVHAVLFVAFDGRDPHAELARCPLVGVASAVIGRGDALHAKRVQVGARWSVSLSLNDTQVSRRHARLERRGMRWTLTDLGSHNGTKVDGERVGAEPRIVEDDTVIEIGRYTLVFRRVALSPHETRFATLSSLPAPHQELAMLSLSLAADVDEAIAVVTRSGSALLLEGASGTGKEVVARAVHARLAAEGRSGAFVAVNCGALPATLVEAELFGARKGAFSGAEADRLGLIRAAEGGTLFLDEIGDLAARSQAALLRVLQEREVLPIGETEPIAVDIAVVAATNRDLADLIEADRFRSDLYARLAGFTLELPPLAERREDLGVLVARLLTSIGAPSELRFQTDAIRALFRYPWPRNIRELASALRRAVALTGDGQIGLAHLPKEIASWQPAGTSQAETEPGVRSAKDARIRVQLLELLQCHHGNLAAVARDMGKHRRQIHRWLQRFEIDPESFRPT